MIFGTVSAIERLIRGGGKKRSRRMFNSREAASPQLVLQLLFQYRSNEIGSFRYNLLQKARADRIDKVRSKDRADQQISRIGMPGFLVIPGHPVIIAVLPESLGIDTLLFDVRETEPRGVEVVEGKEARDAVSPCHGRNEPGHPVVTVNQVGIHSGDDLVDNFTLESERDLDGFPARVNKELWKVIKRSILDQMDALVQTYPRSRSGRLALYYRGVAQLQLGKPREAQKALEDFLASSPDSFAAPMARATLARALDEAGDHQKALDLYEQLTRGEAGDYPPQAALMEMGLCLEKMGKKDEAKKIYERITREFPNSDYSQDAQIRLKSLS